MNQNSKTNMKQSETEAIDSTFHQHPSLKNSYKNPKSLSTTEKLFQNQQQKNKESEILTSFELTFMKIA
jgi:hypothetical protein